MATRIHQALEEIRLLKSRILEKQKFKGYSGRARAIGGSVALAGGLLGSSLTHFQSDPALLLLWLTVAFIAGLINFGALFYWFVRHPDGTPKWVHLKPVLPFALILWTGVGSTIALSQAGAPQLHYGFWMSLYGLGYFLSLHVLPRGIASVGLFYLFCGGLLLWFPQDFQAGAWIMGLVFFVGEWWAGFVLHLDEGEHTHVFNFFGFPKFKQDTQP